VVAVVGEGVPAVLLADRDNGAHRLAPPTHRPAGPLCTPCYLSVSSPQPPARLRATTPRAPPPVPGTSTGSATPPQLVIVAHMTTWPKSIARRPAATRAVRRRRASACCVRACQHDHVWALGRLAVQAAQEALARKLQVRRASFTHARAAADTARRAPRPGTCTSN
jgi:hypothetical protein